MKNDDRKNAYGYLYKVPIRITDDVTQVANGKELDQVELDKVDYVQLDLETDLCGESGKIIHIVVAKISKGKVVERFASYIYPGYELSDSIVELTHCSNLYFDKSKNRKDIITRVRDFIGNAVILTTLYEYSAYIRELKNNSLDDYSRAWIDVKTAVNRITNECSESCVYRMFKEIKTSDISIAGIQDKYIDLCIIILQTFTIKQLYTLGMVNEFYQHSNLDSLVGFGFCDIYAVINNTKGLKRLIQVAQKKKYALDDEYAEYLEISTKDLIELSNQVDFALDGEDSSYFWRNMLKGEQSTYGELLFKYASVIRANLVDAVASKIDKKIDYDTIRNAYMKEIKEALDNGYAVVPAKVFDDIKLVSLSDLYRIYKIL